MPRPLSRTTMSTCEVVRSSHRWIRRPLSILLLPPSCDRYERCALAPGSAAHLSCRLVSVHLRHPEVKQNDLRFESLPNREGLHAVIDRANIVASKLKLHGQRLSGVVVVISDENAERCNRRNYP